MKTKIILIAVITIIGISLFSAFKQSEGSKKYLTITFNVKDFYIIDENGVITEKKSTSANNMKGIAIDITKEINAISSKGYRLISINTLYNQYIFEKE